MAATGSESSNDQKIKAVEPQPAEEYAGSGWVHYGKREFYRAEADFRKALEYAPDDIQTIYGIGLCMHASGRPQEAAEVFDRVIQMAGSLADNAQTQPPQQYVRANMLSRMAQDHLSRMKPGETDPEKK